jgi:autotransporter adhesin
MESPAVPAGGKLALSLGVGTWEGRQAMAGAASYRVSPNAIVSAGVGIGLNRGKVGARAGVQVAW